MELDEAIRITINVRDTYDLSLEERDALALLCNFVGIMSIKIWLNLPMNLDTN
jgi:hypothetical protein